MSLRDGPKGLLLLNRTRTCGRHYLSSDGECSKERGRAPSEGGRRPPGGDTTSRGTTHNVSCVSSSRTPRRDLLSSDGHTHPLTSGRPSSFWCSFRVPVSATCLGVLVLVVFCVHLPAPGTPDLDYDPLVPPRRPKIRPLGVSNLRPHVDPTPTVVTTVVSLPRLWKQRLPRQSERIRVSTLRLASHSGPETALGDSPTSTVTRPPLTSPLYTL